MSPCHRLHVDAGVLTVEEAERIFGRPTITRDIPYEAGDGFICGDLDPQAFCAVKGCDRFSGYLCDYPLGRGKTCDAPLCGIHAMPVGGQSAELMRPHDIAARRDPQASLRFEQRKATLDDLHYCPAHLAAATRSKP